MPRGQNTEHYNTTGFRKLAAWLLSGSHACFAIGKLQACLLQSLPCQSKTYWHCKDRRFLQSRMAEDLQCISGRVAVLRIDFHVFPVVFGSFWKHVVALRQGVWMPQVHGCPDRTDVLPRCYGSSTHASPLGPGQACGKHWRHADVYSYEIQQTLQIRKWTCHPMMFYMFYIHVSASFLLDLCVKGKAGLIFTRSIFVVLCQVWQKPSPSWAWRESKTRPTSLPPFNMASIAGTRLAKSHPR